MGFVARFNVGDDVIMMDEAGFGGGDDAVVIDEAILMFWHDEPA